MAESHLTDGQSGDDAEDRRRSRSAELLSKADLFSGVDRADRSYEPDPQVREVRLALEKQKSELAAGRESIPLARLLDRTEVRLRRWWKRIRS